MYGRYFMWNFAGKQNDIQGFPGNLRWQLADRYSFFDSKVLGLGDQDNMPDSIKHNKANNKLFSCLLSSVSSGLVFHYFKNRKDFLVAGSCSSLPVLPLYYT